MYLAILQTQGVILVAGASSCAKGDVRSDGNAIKKNIARTAVQVVNLKGKSIWSWKKNGNA